MYITFFLKSYFLQKKLLTFLFLLQLKYIKKKIPSAAGLGLLRKMQSTCNGADADINQIKLEQRCVGKCLISTELSSVYQSRLVY